MLLLFKGEEVKDFLGGEVGERDLLVIGRVVCVFVVEGKEAGEDGHGACGPEHVDGRRCIVLPVFGLYVGGCLVNEGGAHLAGDHALPDKFVEFHLVLVQVGLKIVRVTEAGGWAYGLVGLLGGLGPGLVGAGGGGDVLCTELFGDVATGLAAGFVGYGWGVGSHVGYEADLPFTSDGQSFV